MRKCLFVALGLLGFASFAASSQAADLAVRKAPPSQVFVAAPVFNPWTGLYGGFNAGYVAEQFGNSGTPKISTGDGAFGVQLGYNWMAGNWLYGVEGDLQTTTGHVGSSNGFCTAGAIACSVNARLNGFGTIRGRVGAMVGPGVVYATGGGAFMNIGSQLFAPLASANVQSGGTWRTGWTAGAGYEQMLWGRWSGKFEYLYMAASGPSLTTGGATANFDVRAHLLRAGINYHF